MKKAFATITAVLACAASSQAATMAITEWMYQGGGTGGAGEFIEFTNISSTAINLSGWSFDDDSRASGTVPLSGIVQPGQSIILTDMSADAFRTVWNLDASVLVIGNNGTNLGRADEINLYNGSTLVDRLTFGDAVYAGTPRTQAISGITDPDFYNLNDVTKWKYSSVTDGPTIGDGLSWVSTQGEIGSPGVALVPEPSAALLLGAAGLAGGLRRRRKA